VGVRKRRGFCTVGVGKGAKVGSAFGHTGEGSICKRILDLSSVGTMNV
jgi:hypothetical protein